MIGTDEQVRRTEIFQRWMEKRGRIQRSIAWLLVTPAVILTAAFLAFWFQYYLPVPMIAALAFLGASACAFVICLVLALVRLRRLADGDRIMWKMKLSDTENS
jgi:Na+/melibiose symporter-like transporter